MTAEAPFPLPVTAWAIAALEPHEWIHVGDFLAGIVGRAPLTGDGWAAERVVLGALAAELKQNALLAGEPVEEDPAEVTESERVLEAAAQATKSAGDARDEAFRRDAATARRQAIADELDAAHQQEDPSPPPEPVAADLSWFD